MARLLLADPDRTRADVLAVALNAAGHDTTLACSGVEALTRLQDSDLDLLVTRDTVGDLEGADLVATVRANPATRTMPIAMLGGVADDADLVLRADIRLPALLTGIENVLALHGRHYAPVAKTTPRAATGLRGSLDVMDVSEVAQAIALGQKTGRLSFTMPAGNGLVVFEAGRIIHAEYGALAGERAFAALVAAARAGGDFCFTATARADVPAVRRTIEGTVGRLLLATASDMDEGRRAPTGSTGVEDT
jgi:CheY-like chemotaxis protein